MSTWSPTHVSDLTKKQPTELRALIEQALDLISYRLGRLEELADTRQRGIGFLTPDARVAVNQQLRKERAARYPTTLASGAPIPTGLRGLVLSHTITAMPGERPVPVNLTAVSLSAEIPMTLLDINRRIRKDLLAAGVCHIHKPLDRPTTIQVIGETRRLVAVVASTKRLLQITRSVEELCERIRNLVDGNDKERVPGPCPHCRRRSLVVYLDEGIIRCERDPHTGDYESCICTDTYCQCKRRRRDDPAARHQWLRSARASRSDSWRGLKRAQADLDRETAHTTTEGASTVPDSVTVVDAPHAAPISAADPFHQVEVSIDHGYARMRFLCTAPEGTRCRQLPACYVDGGACVDHSEDGTHRDGCTDHGRLVDIGECNVSLWINGSDDVHEAGQGTIRLPVATSWNGDGFDWSFATGAAEVTA